MMHWTMASSDDGITKSLPTISHKHILCQTYFSVTLEEVRETHCTESHSFEMSDHLQLLFLSLL